MVPWNWFICCCAVLCFHGAGLISASGEGFSLFLCSPPVNSPFKSRSLICVIPFPWRQDSVSFHHLLSSTVNQLTFHVSATFILSGQVKSAPPSSSPQYCFLPESEPNTSVRPYTWEPLCSISCGLFQVVLVVKNLPAKAGDVRETGLIPGSGRSPGEAHGNPLQYSCLENLMDRGDWRAMVHGVTKSQT